MHLSVVARIGHKEIVEPIGLSTLRLGDSIIH
jgi:hypothetical protein